MNNEKKHGLKYIDNTLFIYLFGVTTWCIHL